jgi:NAD/NADP transhydrogenase beta subunit
MYHAVVYVPAAAIIVEHSTIPSATPKAMAIITKAIINPAIKADVRAPITGIPVVKSTSKAPVTGCP